MNKRQMMLITVTSTFLTLTIIVGLMFLFSRAMAAPLAETANASLSQTTTGSLQYASISALAFEPIRQDIAYAKDVQGQMLSLTSQVRNFNANSNLFIAPLALPDRSELIGLTVFGQDFDNLGEVRLRLKRCNHSQAFCDILAETTSTTPYALGQFETTRVSLLNEIVDNRFYSYFLELDLTALGNSGLRSVRLEIVTGAGATGPSTEAQWSLTGNARSFLLPNTGMAQVRICANDLSHLPNVTHFPFIVIDDDQITPLSSGACVTIWGREIEIRRQLNTGPSSGTYQFLR